MSAEGFYGAGATIAARLLGPWINDAHLLNVTFDDGLVRWMELRPSGIWVRRKTPKVTEGHFPYGWDVAPP